MAAGWRSKSVSISIEAQARRRIQCCSLPGCSPCSHNSILELFISPFRILPVNAITMPLRHCLKLQTLLTAAALVVCASANVQHDLKHEHDHDPGGTSTLSFPHAIFGNNRGDIKPSTPDRVVAGVLPMDIPGLLWEESRFAGSHAPNDEARKAAVIKIIGTLRDTGS